MREVAAVLLAMVFGFQFQCTAEEAAAEPCPPDARYASDVMERARAAREVLEILDIDDECAAEVKEWIIEEPEPIIRHDLFAALVDRAEDSDAEWLLSYLEDADPTLRAQAAAVAEDELTQELTLKLAELLPLESYWWVRWRLVSTLYWADGDAVLDALNDALEDEAREVQEAAAEALSSMPDQRSLKPLMRAMDQWPLDATEHVVDALGGIGDPAAVPALAMALGAIRDSVRLAAASAIGRIDSRESVRLLEDLLSGTDVVLAVSASEGLMQLDDEESIAALSEFALSHPSEDLVEWLGRRVGDNQAAACAPLLRKVESGSPASRDLRRICDELQRREEEGIVVVTSACGFGGRSIDYEVLSASARKIAPSDGAEASAWLEYPGDALGGTRVTFPADLIVMVEDAILQGGEAWLLVSDSSTDTEYWIPESETRRISQEEWDEIIEILRFSRQHTGK